LSQPHIKHEFRADVDVLISLLENLAGLTFVPRASTIPASPAAKENELNKSWYMRRTNLNTHRSHNLFSKLGIPSLIEIAILPIQNSNKLHEIPKGIHKSIEAVLIIMLCMPT
jgi:hypothetical protein